MGSQYVVGSVFRAPNVCRKDGRDASQLVPFSEDLSIHGASLVECYYHGPFESGGSARKSDPSSLASFYMGV